jgi:hypothetical protein
MSIKRLRVVALIVVAAMGIGGALAYGALAGSGAGDAVRNTDADGSFYNSGSATITVPATESR